MYVNKNVCMECNLFMPYFVKNVHLCLSLPSTKTFLYAGIYVCMYVLCMYLKNSIQLFTISDAAIHADVCMNTAGMEFTCHPPSLPVCMHVC